ncbi:MAG: hypothetical protein AAF907_13935, partial [Planctomycetota bacterium]
AAASDGRGSSRLRRRAATARLRRARPLDFFTFLSPQFMSPGPLPASQADSRDADPAGLSPPRRSFRRRPTWTKWLAAGASPADSVVSFPAAPAAEVDSSPPSPTRSATAERLADWERLSTQELYELARRKGIRGRSLMTRDELLSALDGIESLAWG